MSTYRAHKFRKQPPEGWELIEPTINEFDKKMREGECFEFISFEIPLAVAESDPHEGKRKVEALWPVFRIHHQRSRYIFDLFYKRKAISRGTLD